MQCKQERPEFRCPESMGNDVPITQAWRGTQADSALLAAGLVEMKQR